MFREMRRNKQLLSMEENIAILNRATSGVLAVLGDDEYPYAVPVSFIYSDSKIYFHCAKVGHKIDAITKHNKVSFCVTDCDQIVPEEFTTYFRSVIAFGKARILENPEEKRNALKEIAERYSPEQVEGRKKEIEDTFDRVCLVEIAIEHMTGKEAIELVRKKQK